MDVIHEEAVRSAIQIKELQDQISELKKENARLEGIISKPMKIEKVEPMDEVKEVVKVVFRRGPKIAPKKEMEDEKFAKEAETFVDAVNVVEEKVEEKVEGKEKSKKEYQQEYQREYRKLKREKQVK